MNERDLKTFGATIQRLIRKEDLSRAEAREAFGHVLSGRQPDLQQGAFLAALVAKGETAAEIAGSWEAIDALDTVHVTPAGAPMLVENSGTGMDSLKTFNVSTAAAIVAATAGVRMARHGARALTSFCGTVDILESLGLDVECDPGAVARSIEEAGIGLFNGMSPKVHPQALGRILSQIRFGSTLNIAASLANPARPRRAVRGVYAAGLLPLVADVMKEIGIERGLVVHGLAEGRRGGMDELSVCGESLVVEFGADMETRSARVAPRDLGLGLHPFESIASTGSLASESERMAGVLAGKASVALADFTALNAGAILLVAGHAPTLAEGVGMARDILASGRCVDTVRRWIRVQGNGRGEAGLKRFDALLSTNPGGA